MRLLPFGLLVAVNSFSQTNQAVTVDYLMSLATVVDVKISPSGADVAYVVSNPNLSKNQHEASLWVVPSTGGHPRRLAETTRILNTPLPAPRLRWSPDGTRIGFLGLKDGVPQVYAVSTKGNVAEPVTEAPEGVSGFEWSPDGKAIAYLTRDPVPADEQQRRKDQSFVTQVDAPPPHTRIVYKSFDGSFLTVTPGDQYVESFSFSPDGKEIAFAASATTGFTAQYATRIYAVLVNGGQPRKVVDRPGMNSTPRYSPDGTKIAFISSNGLVSIMAPRGLCVAPSQGENPASIKSYPLDGAWISDVTWSNDSKTIYLLATDGTYGQREHMFEQPIVRVNVADGKTTLLRGGKFAHYSVSLSTDGIKLACRRVGARDMGEVVLYDLKNQKEYQLTESNPQLKLAKLGEMKVISWKSFDSMEIWGLLITPHGGSGKLPLLVYSHGGPNGGVSYGLFPQFMHVVSQVDYYPVEAMVSAGFVVFFPMPRGGMGYGEAGQRAIINDWGGADFQDIMTGVDHLIAQGIADEQRMGIMGASYGGYMTNWVVTQTDRFRAASAGASISDLEDQYLLSDGGEPMAEYFRKPWEAREAYSSRSPLTHAANVKTPLLIQHGERDMRVPSANAYKFYRALKQMGKTVELDIHPRSSHVFYEPMQERAAMQRNLDWFKRWILDQ